MIENQTSLNRQLVLPSDTIEPVTFENPSIGVEQSSYNLLATIIDLYRDLHNLENGNQGSRQSHTTLVTEQYSPNILPVLATMHNYAISSGNQTMLMATTQSLQDLGNALEVLGNYTKKIGRPQKAAMHSLRAGGVRGEDVALEFRRTMRVARNTAVLSIEKFFPDIPVEVELSFQRGEYKTLHEQAIDVLQEHREARYGVDLGKEFTEKLHSPQTKVLAISLDINSTLNLGESHASPENINRATAQMQELVALFQEMYPEKDIIIAPNTGRPALYAWGVLEMLPSFPAIRKLGLAESGGVVFSMDGTQQVSEVAVANSRQWREQLNDLQQYLLKQMQNPEIVVIEPKSSMLSIKLARAAEDGGGNLHRTFYGEEITDEWIEERTQAWLTERQLHLQEQLHALTLSETEDTNMSLQQEVSEESNSRIHSVVQLRAALISLSYMKEKLQISFNPTAGYVDIFHKDLNKYGTLLNAIRNMGYTTDEILALHIGDASTDIAPTENTSNGEANEGADTVFTVAVANSSQKLKEAVAQRGTYGIQTARDSILGVSDVITGITQALLLNSN